MLNLLEKFLGAKIIHRELQDYQKEYQQQENVVLLYVKLDLKEYDGCNGLFLVELKNDASDFNSLELIITNSEYSTEYDIFINDAIIPKFLKHRRNVYEKELLELSLPQTFKSTTKRHYKI